MRLLRLARVSIAAIVLSLTPQAAFAQSPTSAPSPPAPVRDAQAIATVQSAITATGGVTAICAIQSSVTQGTSVASVGVGGGTTTNFTWSHSGKDFRYQDDATSGGHIFVSNGGIPCDIEGGIVVPSAAHIARASLLFHIPALVLFNELDNPNYTLTYVGATTLNGTSAIHIQALVTECILVGGLVEQETSRPPESPPDTQRLVGYEQETVDEKQSPQPPEPSQPTPQIHIPVLGTPNEFALVTDLEYYEPEPGFNRQNRDIDLQVARAGLAAHFGQGWEFQFDVLAIRAKGTAVLSSTPPIPPPVPSNALALGAGPLARWNVLQFNRWRLFVDAEGDLILNDRPFPPHGTSYDFFLRAGGGVSVRVSDRYWVESAFRFAHISNGLGFDSGNPGWQGRELSIGIRRTFGPYQETERKTTLPVSGEAKEKAWITSAEYYWATPGSNLQNPKNLHAMRALRISRTWPFPKGFELQLGGMVSYPKNGNIFGFGPLLRWNFLQNGRCRLFADAGADILQTGNTAYIIPLGGTGYNFFLRASSGVSFRLHSAYWLDASFRFAHITTGFGPGGDSYIPWSGLGVSLALRHTFH